MHVQDQKEGLQYLPSQPMQFLESKIIEKVSISKEGEALDFKSFFIFFSLSSLKNFNAWKHIVRKGRYISQKV